MHVHILMCMYVRIYEHTYACRTDSWMDGWMDGWMDANVCVHMYIYVYV